MSTLPHPPLTLGRVYREDCTAQQGVFGWLVADGRETDRIVCGSHMLLPLNQAHQSTAYTTTMVCE